MTPFRRLLYLTVPVLAVGLVAPLAVRAGEQAAPSDPGPEVVVHVPVNEMDVLLEADRRGVVLRHAQYVELLETARARAEVLGDRAPFEGALLSADGVLDLSTPDEARLEVTYGVEVLAEGPSVVPFQVSGLAVESLALEGEGRYEELDGRGRLRFSGPGRRTLGIVGWAVVHEEGEQRWLDLGLPPAAAMALGLKLPPAISGAAHGEGPPLSLETPASEGAATTVRPTHEGRVRVAWGPAARGEEGPPLLDVLARTVHSVDEGVVRSKIVLQADVLRRPVDALSLEVPEQMALRSVDGEGVVGSSRSEDRRSLRVDLDGPRRGTVLLELDAETPYEAGPGVRLPRVRVEDATRQRADVVVGFGARVEVQDVRVTGGRRVESAREPQGPPRLRYALARADGEIQVDLVPGDVRLEAVATWYLNLTEPAKTLHAAVTYRVTRGAAYRLVPRFPPGYELRSLEIDGRRDGFGADPRADGSLEILLDRGVREGGTILLVATLEQAAADWVPEQGEVAVPFPVPDANAARTEGYLGIGADASFRVLDAEARDLVAVGAAELTERGVSPAGLVYGYRLDGDDPFVALRVERRTPRLDATVVAVAEPTPRRLNVECLVLHTIERAGVRRLLVDVPAWAGDTVKIEAPSILARSRVEPRPDGVPEGYDRWEVTLGTRVLGSHRMLVRYHEDRTEDDWVFDAERPLAVRLPLERVERYAVVTRANGLEVTLLGSAPLQDLGELPVEAGLDPLLVREVVRLDAEGTGPGIAVKKHPGAAVLEAIATRVDIQTAVAPEGILRSRAEVRLVNVGLQFLVVSLPPTSGFVGATVDGKSVKPLADPQGHLRIPIPPAREAEQTTLVAFTWSTRMPGRAEGTVEVPAPDFPGLEVLECRHEVAFDPAFEVLAVEGDYGRTRGPQETRYVPWVLRLLGAASRRVVSGVDVAAPASCREPSSGQAGSGPQQEMQIRDHMETDNDLPYEESFGEEGLSDAPFDGPARSRMPQQGLSAGRHNLPASDADRLRRLADEVGRLQDFEAPQVALVERPQGLEAPLFGIDVPPEDTAGDGRRSSRPDSPGPLSPTTPSPTPVPPGTRAPTDPVPPPPWPVAPPLPGGEPVADPAAPPGDPGAGGQPGRPGGSPAAGGEGPGEPPRLPPRPPRRKGLLSLDVRPVLSPNRVEGTRLGGGGTMTIEVARRADETASYWFIFLLSVALGLALAARSARAAIVVPALFVTLAVLDQAIFGRTAALEATAILDATSVLVVVLLLRALVRRLFLGGAARTAAVTAAVLAFLVLVPAAARADDVLPDEVPSVETRKVVYVPYDPDDPTVPRPGDRVFLPLDTWLHLRKLANPDEDPDVLARGRVATLLEARHRVVVRHDEAEGALRLRIARRGTGPVLVPLHLGGLAVTRATLDGQSVRLVLEDGTWRVPLEGEGDHEIAIDWRAPAARDGAVREVVIDVPPFAGATLDVVVTEFDGEIRVPGAGRVQRLPSPTAGDRTARIALGALARVRLRLEDPRPAEPEVPPRTRAESRIVHSIRDGGTESRLHVDLHVLQGEALEVALDLPADVTVLAVTGGAVARWETAQERLEIVFGAPQRGVVTFDVALRRPAPSPVRTEELPALAVLDTTGERGTVVVNADEFLRVEPRMTEGLLRTATPRDAAACGPDRQGRVAGAWQFAARPTRFEVAVELAETGLSIETTAAVAFGDDTVRTRFDATVEVDARVAVGELVFDLPGTDEVRALRSAGLDTWWLEGEDEGRSLHLRYRTLRTGSLGIAVWLQRRLGGARDAVPVPYWTLRGARRDAGRLVLFARSDVDPDPGRLPGLRSIPLAAAAVQPPVPGATPERAFRWEEPVRAPLPVTLRTPSLDVEAVVVTSVHPGDDAHRVDHLVLFDVRRGATDRFDVFVPDCGFGALDVVRTRDLREIRERRVRRRGTDGVEVDGTLYEIRTQAPQGGIVEVTVTQVCAPDVAVRVVRPERVSGEADTDRELESVRWFGLVRTFLDGEVTVRPLGTPPERALWEDLPFVPTGLEAQDVEKLYVASAPYALDVVARRQPLQGQVDAVVRAVQADVVLGRDGDVRVRATYRLFNRHRQFLRLRLPRSSVLFGVTVAGFPVKPLEGEQGLVLVPVPKVPLGGAGYLVSVLFRATVGGPLSGSDLARVVLPAVLDAEVDRTIIRLFAPEEFDYDIETSMSEVEAADVAADLAEAAVREAKDLLEVAESGTLEQRRRAAGNAALLVAEANELNRRSGKKRKGLDREVDQVSREFQEKSSAVAEDLEAAGRAAAGQQIEIYASNALPMVQLDEGRVQLQAGSEMLPAQVSPTPQAQWRYNPTLAQAEGGKQEFQDLKERLGRALEDRSKDAVQDVEVEVAQASNLAGLIRGDGEVVEPDATWKNFGVLNGYLVEEQRRNRQLGVVTNLDDVTNGLEDQAQASAFEGGGGRVTGAALDPSSGIFFNDGEDLDFRARTENLFARYMLGYGFQGQQGASGYLHFAGDGDNAAVTRGETRSGLMGVDVALPQRGKVFHFRSLREGAPLEITVSEEEIPDLWKWVLFVVGMVGLVGVAVYLVRR